MHFNILEIHFLGKKIRQIFLKPDRSRNWILKPDIRPGPDSAGYPVGFYSEWTIINTHILANIRPGGYYNGKVLIVNILKQGVCGCQASMQEYKLLLIFFIF